MDLNRDPTAEKPDRDGWLPRGAMDLNLASDAVLPAGAGWLPRGAMDLNISVSIVRIALPSLAPSWSHGSKFGV